MAIKSRKGFIYTLEATMASLMILGVAVTVLPDFQQQFDFNPERQTLSGLQTLEKTGDLTDSFSTSDIESDLEPYVPITYNYSVDIIEVERVERNISSPYQKYFSGNGSNSELQLWIDSASDLDVTFDGEKVVEDHSSSGYKQVSLTGTEGWLNFTGSAELEFSFDTYNSSKTSIDAEHVSATGYIVLQNGTKEIRVRLWK